MCIDILFCCCHAEPRAYICGSLLQSRVIHFKSGCDYFGVRLWPENSIRTSRLQLRELLNQEIPFQDVWSVSSSLPERIAGSSSFAERAELFQEFGGSLIAEEPPGTSRMVTHCIKAIIQGTGSVPIHSLAQEVGYTSRYLRKKFEEEVGVSPKLFSRIIRFQHALQQLSRCEHDMLDVVAANDYYDQSHLIHEFKKFDFLSPSEWVRLNTPKVH
ncbi:Helix-turn-helix domain protein [compost metagenome]